jgi:hypothetical protein
VRQVGGGRGLRWSARSERRPICEAVDRGPCGFVYFPIYAKLAQLGNYLPPKIPKFCMLVTWNIMNIFLHGADIQFPTQIELKIMDQIHLLKFC